MHHNNQAINAKRESGYALIVVLLVITVFSILGLTVMSVSVNHSKQFSKETTQTQALNVAEMGLKAYDRIIDNVLEQNINNDIPKSFDELVSRIDDKINDGTLPSELTADSKIQSLQGTPSYTVQMTKQNIPSLNEVKLSLTSTSNVQGNHKTITQVKTFNYQVTNNENNGENQDNSDDLNLPKLNGSLIMGDSDNANLKDPSNKQNQMDNIYIYPYTSTNTPDKRCYGAFNTSSISNFENTFSTIQNILYQATTPKAEVTNLPNTKPNLTNYGALADWTLPNADSSSLNPVKSSNFARSVNFQDTKTESSQTISFPENVSTKSLTIGANTVVAGNLFVNGNLMLDKPLTVHGSLFVNGSINQNGNATLSVDNDAYFENNLMLNQPVSIGGNVYSDGSLQVNSNGNLDIDGNLFIRGSVGVDGELKVRENGYFNDSIQVNGNGNLIVGQSLFVKASTGINGKITTGIDFYPSGNMNLNGNALADIGGNLRVGGVVNNDGEIKVSGNAYFRSDVNAGNGNVRIGIKGYSFFENNVSLFGSGGNKGASEFVGTVYVKGTATVKQNHVNPNVTPLLLNFYHGLVVKNKANLTTTGQGEIDIGPIGTIENDGSDTDNGGSVSREHVTVSTSETNYH